MSKCLLKLTDINRTTHSHMNTQTKRSKKNKITYLYMTNPGPGTFNLIKGKDIDAFFLRVR